jgi:hypothetical protein
MKKELHELHRASWQGHSDQLAFCFRKIQSTCEPSIVETLNGTVCSDLRACSPCNRTIDAPKNIPKHATMASSQNASGQPLIAILTLDKPDFFSDMFGGFIHLLKMKAEVRQIATPEDATTVFNSNPKPTVILSADQSLVDSTRTSLVQDIVSYVRAGGILVFMGLFVIFSRGARRLIALFSSLDLSWQWDAYYRTTFQFNRETMHFDRSVLIPPGYSQKALQLANVAFEDAVYLPTRNAVVKSTPSVIGGTRVSDRIRTPPVAFAKVGEGRIRLVGDVSWELETTFVILRMCGL